MPFTVQPTLQSTPRQLAQVRPSGVANENAYSPADGITTEIERIVVCNQTAAGETFRLFHDEDGTTYTQATCLYYDEPISANKTEIISGPFYMNNPNGSFGVRSSNGSSITFTFYGKETQPRAR